MLLHCFYVGEEGLLLVIAVFAEVGVTGGDCMPLSTAEVVPVEAVLAVTIDVGLEVTPRVVEIAPGVVVMALASGVLVVAVVVMVVGGVEVITSVDSELVAGVTSSSVAVVSISSLVE